MDSNRLQAAGQVLISLSKSGRNIFDIRAENERDSGRFNSVVQRTLYNPLQREKAKLAVGSAGFAKWSDGEFVYFTRFERTFDLSRDDIHLHALVFDADEFKRARPSPSQLRELTISANDVREGVVGELRPKVQIPVDAGDSHLSEDWKDGLSFLLREGLEIRVAANAGTGSIRLVDEILGPISEMVEPEISYVTHLVPRTDVYFNIGVLDSSNPTKLRKGPEDKEISITSADPKTIVRSQEFLQSIGIGGQLYILDSLNQLMNKGSSIEEAVPNLIRDHRASVSPEESIEVRTMLFDQIGAIVKFPNASITELVKEIVDSDFVNSLKFPSTTEFRQIAKMEKILEKIGSETPSEWKDLNLSISEALTREHAANEIAKALHKFFEYSSFNEALNAIKEHIEEGESLNEAFAQCIEKYIGAKDYQLRKTHFFGGFPDVLRAALIQKDSIEKVQELAIEYVTDPFIVENRLPYDRDFADLEELRRRLENQEICSERELGSSLHKSLTQSLDAHKANQNSFVSPLELLNIERNEAVRMLNEKSADMPSLYEAFVEVVKEQTITAGSRGKSKRVIVNGLTFVNQATEGKQTHEMVSLINNIVKEFFLDPEHPPTQNMCDSLTGLVDFLKEDYGYRQFFENLKEQTDKAENIRRKSLDSLMELLDDRSEEFEEYFSEFEFDESTLSKDAERMLLASRGNKLDQLGGVLAVVRKIGEFEPDRSKQLLTLVLSTLDKAQQKNEYGSVEEVTRRLLFTRPRDSADSYSLLGDLVETSAMVFGEESVIKALKESTQNIIGLHRESRSTSFVTQLWGGSRRKSTPS